MTAAIQITNDFIVYAWPLIGACLAAMALVAWRCPHIADRWIDAACRRWRIPMTEHERIPNDPTRSNR